MDRRKLNDKLAEPDFYLEWSPGIYPAIPNNDGPCKRYWAGREKTKKGITRMQDLGELSRAKTVQRLQWRSILGLTSEEEQEY